MTEDVIVRELRRVEARISCIDQKLDKVRAEDIPALRVEISALKVKAGIWGFLAGAIPAAVTVLLILLRDHLP